MTWSAASWQFGQAIARAIRFQLGLMLMAGALFVAGCVGATATGLLGVLFAILVTGTVVFVAAFVIRTTVIHGKQALSSERERNSDATRALDELIRKQENENSGRTDTTEQNW